MSPLLRWTEVQHSKRKHGDVRWKCERHSLPKQQEQHNNQKRLEEQCVRVMKTAMAVTPGRGFRTAPPEICMDVSKMEDYKKDCGIS